MQHPKDLAHLAEPLTARMARRHDEHQAEQRAKSPVQRQHERRIARQVVHRVYVGLCAEAGYEAPTPPATLTRTGARPRSPR